MATYTQILYHIIFSTKNRENVMLKNRREELLKYIWGIAKNRKCHLYRINAVNDHIHLLTHLHQSIALSDFVKVIKTGSSKWIKENRIFPEFEHWQDGYGAFTCSINDKNRLIEYIKHQENHHKQVTYKEEYINLLHEAGIEYDEKYIW